MIDKKLIVLNSFANIRLMAHSMSISFFEVKNLGFLEDEIHRSVTLGLVEPNPHDSTIPPLKSLEIDILIQNIYICMGDFCD